MIELIGNKVIINDEKLASKLHSKGSIGVIVKQTLELSLVEAFYLISKGKIELKISKEQFMKKANRLDKRFYIRYKVFEDLRSKGYVIKTALKYGFDFRVYDKGSKPGKVHARWLVACFNENEKYNWKDFSKNMRISHSVKKKALIAIVDDEGDTTYWESSWKKL